MGIAEYYTPSGRLAREAAWYQYQARSEAGEQPKNYTQHLENGESLKSRNKSFSSQ
jgi:hypothetical protein